jgi:ketosteroid isomerase-like protein
VEMSAGNAELARRYYDAFNREGLDAISGEHFHDDVVVAEPPEMPDAAVTQGLESARAGLARFVELFDDVTVTVDEVVEKGERTLTTISVSAAGKGSGVALDSVRYDIATWSNGRIARLDLFFTRALAEEAFKGGAG